MTTMTADTLMAECYWTMAPHDQGQGIERMYPQQTGRPQGPPRQLRNLRLILDRSEPPDWRVELGGVVVLRGAGTRIPTVEQAWEAATRTQACVWHIAIRCDADSSPDQPRLHARIVPIVLTVRGSGDGDRWYPNWPRELARAAPNWPARHFATAADALSYSRGHFLATENDMHRCYDQHPPASTIRDALLAAQAECQG